MDRAINRAPSERTIRSRVTSTRAGISASVIALSRSVKCFTFGWLKCPDYGNGPANYPTQAGEKGKGEVS
jgi:hypothetical protein